ncbi:hypothetical protein V5O48_011542 [Marasmius crinis-equi]|uniref:Uncharacterized protein n=1 Tax=Marasmius crinis-equi TaxID=585013 RepID=A0ABR3F5B4_9AGAR
MSYYRPGCLEHTELVEPSSTLLPTTGPARNPKLRHSSAPPYHRSVNSAPKPAFSPAVAPRLTTIDTSDSSSEDAICSPKSPPAPEFRSTAQAPQQVREPSPSRSMNGSDSDYSLEVPADDEWENLPKIPKPEGEAGRPKRGGYNLEEKLGWDGKLLTQVKSFVKNQVLKKLDCSVPFTLQPPAKIKEIQSLGTEKFPILRRYEDCWAVDDLIRCNLKYQKQKLTKEQNEVLASRERARELVHEGQKALQQVIGSPRMAPRGTRSDQKEKAK